MVWLNYYEMRLYATNFQSGVEGQGNTWTDNGIDRQTDHILYTGTPSEIENSTSNSIRIYSDKSPTINYI